MVFTIASKTEILIICMQKTADDWNQEYLNKWKYYSQIRRLDIATMSILPNLFYRYNTIPIKTPASYFVYIHKLILKFIWTEEPTLKNKRLMRTETSIQDREPQNRLIQMQPTDLWQKSKGTFNGETTTE
jgi:hypothetical protein